MTASLTPLVRDLSLEVAEATLRRAAANVYQLQGAAETNPTDDNVRRYNEALTTLLVATEATLPLLDIA